MMNNVTWQPGVTLEEMEKKIILAAFRYFHGNKTQTAIALGISIRTLDNKFAIYEGKKDEETELHAETGQRLEPAKKASTEQPLPLPKREEVQSVLPSKAAGSHSRRSR